MAENVASGCFRFEKFELDAGNRQLRHGDTTVELNSRYFDALALLIGAQGSLVSKDRFMAEVWRGIPVTDEALTQCIRTLRRQLGDDAANPRFIETVPKHGYRFIAPVEAAPCEAPTRPSPSTAASNDVLLLGAGGTAGGALAGALGGVLYGFAGASQPLGPGMGAISVVLVVVVVTVAIATLGAAGVSFGIGLASRLRGKPWLLPVLGGAMGGLLVGAVVKLLGLDALNLLFGHAPDTITGAPEGVLIGAAIGLGAWLARDAGSLERAMAWGGMAGAVSGAAVVLLGGMMMAGSLEHLAQSFPGSRIQLDSIGHLFGESHLGPLSLVATGAFEGLLFGACVVGGLTLARRRAG